MKVLGVDNKTVIDLNDIPRGQFKVDLLANAMMNVKRFNGRGFNIALHSFIVGYLIKKSSLSVEDRAVAYKYALLHDMHEVFTGDIIEPVKSSANRKTEEIVQDQILKVFGVVISPRLKAVVRVADQLAMIFELGMRFGKFGKELAAEFDLPMPLIETYIALHNRNVFDHPVALCRAENMIIQASVVQELKLILRELADSSDCRPPYEYFK